MQFCRDYRFGIFEFQWHTNLIGYQNCAHVFFVNAVMTEIANLISRRIYDLFFQNWHTDSPNKLSALSAGSFIYSLFRVNGFYFKMIPSVSGWTLTAFAFLQVGTNSSWMETTA